MDELNIQFEDDNAIQKLQDAAQCYDMITFYHRGDHSKGSYKPGFSKRNINEIDTKNKRDTSKVTCYGCGKKGHIAKDCKSKDKKPYKKKNALVNTESRSINQVTVGLQKLSPQARIPVYKTKEAAGADISPCESGTINKWMTKRVRTGIAVEIPKGYHAKIKARSSMSEQNISITRVINSDYRGEIWLIISNHNPFPINYSAEGNAMAQLIIQPHIQVEFKVVPRLTPTAQKGGFGSTNIEEISIHPRKLVFKGKLNRQNADFLVDSGADGIFCGRNMVKDAKLKPSELSKPITITTADGKEHSITKVAKDIPYAIQGFKDQMDLYIMPVDHDQIILGNHWLDHLNLSINWRKKEATIQRGNKSFTLQVNLDSKTKAIQEIQVNFLTTEDDFKPSKDNQLFLIHMSEDIDEELGITPAEQPDIKDPALNALLDEYKDVFQTELPSEKPTKRDVEHVIRLKENAKPQNA